MSPLYKHDCERCRYLGTVTGPDPCAAGQLILSHDLYHCNRSSAHLGGSIVARYGDGADYCSMPWDAVTLQAPAPILWAWQLTSRINTPAGAARRRTVW